MIGFDYERLSKHRIQDLRGETAGIVAARASAGDDDGAVSAGGSGSAWSDYGRRLGDRHTPGATTWQWSLHP